jgi:hypothetical protein
MRWGAIAIVGIIIAIALAVAIPAMRPAPQVQAPASPVEAPAPLDEFERHNMFDLHAAGKIAFSANGSNIQQVRLEVLSLSDERIRVVVPAGAFFASSDPAAQSMVATRSHEFDLLPRQALSLSIDAACANLPLDIPSSGTGFTITQQPPQPELALIAPMLAAQGYDVRQAAVWIVTDNASFDDLGTLVTGGAYGNMGGVRVIDPEDAVRAMQIVDAAGVDIRARRIWRDRHTLLQSAPEGEARSWLAEISG